MWYVCGVVCVCVCVSLVDDGWWMAGGGGGGGAAWWCVGYESRRGHAGVACAALLCAALVWCVRVACVHVWVWVRLSFQETEEKLPGPGLQPAK